MAGCCCCRSQAPPAAPGGGSSPAPPPPQTVPGAWPSARARAPPAAAAGHQGAGERVCLSRGAARGPRGSGVGGLTPACQRPVCTLGPPAALLLLPSPALSTRALPTLSWRGDRGAERRGGALGVQDAGADFVNVLDQHLHDQRRWGERAQNGLGMLRLHCQSNRRLGVRHNVQTIAACSLTTSQHLRAPAPRSAAPARRPCRGS